MISEIRKRASVLMRKHLHKFNDKSYPHYAEFIALCESTLSGSPSYDDPIAIAADNAMLEEVSQKLIDFFERIEKEENDNHA